MALVTGQSITEDLDGVILTRVGWLFLDVTSGLQNNGHTGFEGETWAVATSEKLGPKFGPKLSETSRNSATLDALAVLRDS